MTHRHQKTDAEGLLAGETGPTKVGENLEEDDEEAQSESRPEFGERKRHRRRTATSETTGPRQGSSTAADISVGRIRRPSSGPLAGQGKPWRSPGQAFDGSNAWCRDFGPKIPASHNPKSVTRAENATDRYLQVPVCDVSQGK